MSVEGGILYVEEGLVCVSEGGVCLCVGGVCGGGDCVRVGWRGFCMCRRRCVLRRGFCDTLPTDTFSCLDSVFSFITYFSGLVSDM